MLSSISNLYPGSLLGAHGVNTTVLGTVNVVLVTENADSHAGARDTGQLDGAGETLVTLGVIVLEADLELDGLEEVALLLLSGCQRCVEKSWLGVGRTSLE